MARVIYTVYATQVVVSDAHPEGIKTDMPDYPKDIDSRTYGATTENPDGNSEIAYIVSMADYWNEIKTLTLANNDKRVKWTVGITRDDGKEIARKAWGQFPDMTPESEPEEPEALEEQ